MTETIQKEETEKINTIEDKTQPTHPITAAIEGLVHRVIDIEECAKLYITDARKSYAERWESILENLNQSQEILQKNPSAEEKLVAARELRKTLRDFKRHKNDSTSQTLERSLFISLFSAFDKFVGEILTAIYQRSPSLYNNLNTQLTLPEVLQYPSMDSLREAVLEKEIETVKRKSYTDQFKDFEKRFNFQTLTSFESWPDFIECSQRRNLFTHCDGIVSQQYLRSCQEAGAKIKNDVQIGDTLKILTRQSNTPNHAA